MIQVSDILKIDIDKLIYLGEINNDYYFYYNDLLLTIYHYKSLIIKDLGSESITIKLFKNHNTTFINYITFDITNHDDFSYIVHIVQSFKPIYLNW